MPVAKDDEHDKDAHASGGVTTGEEAGDEDQGIDTLGSTGEQLNMLAPAQLGAVLGTNPGQEPALETVVAVPEFASSGSDQEVGLEPVTHGRASGRTPLSLLTAQPSQASARRGENPDGSPWIEEETELADELRRVQQDIVAKRQERMMRMEQQLARARHQLQNGLPDNFGLDRNGPGTEARRVGGQVAGVRAGGPRRQRQRLPGQGT